MKAEKKLVGRTWIMKENKELGDRIRAEEGGSMKEKQIIMCDILNKVFFFSNYIAFLIIFYFQG